MIRKIVAAAAPVIAERFTVNSCLNASRVLIEVLRELGIPSRPMAVEALAANAPWAAFMVEHGHAPFEDESPDAWAVGCSSDHRESDKGYEGHVVVWARGFLIDLASGQFARPEREIYTPAALSMPVDPGWERGGPAAVLPLPKDGILSYLALPRERAFKRVAGFERSAHNLDAVRAVQARLLIVA